MRALRAYLSIFVLVGLAACGDNSKTPTETQCFDGIDNDSDGAIDYPADEGCADAADDDETGGIAKPKCNDGRDNDGDGKTDFPNDPGCFDAFGDDETDDCPSGPNCAACSDGQDNDGNSQTDFPNDPGCTSAADDSEFFDNPNACGQGLMIKMLPPSGMDMGMLTASSTSNIITTCGGGAGAPAVAYLFILQEPKVIVASTDNPTTTADTVLDLRAANCSDPGAHLACNDDVSTGNSKSHLVRSLQPGSYYLIVEGHGVTDTGDYQIDVQFFAGEGSACTGDGECGPGLVCRIPVGGTAMVCSDPVCSDGLDDDNDGKIDFPDDPGCSGATDATEDDDCPNGAGCPQCGNAIDDDMDGMTDYPADTSCTSASTNSEACQQSETILVATQPKTVSTTVGATNDYTPPGGQFNGHTCSSTSTTKNAPDVAVQIDVPAMDNLSLKLNPVGYDSAHVLLNSSCGGTPIECYDNPNNMVLSNVAAGRYYLIVDGFSSSSGTFTLNVAGSIKNGESCEFPLAESGAITCGNGYACKGTVGSRTCQPAECNDGADNNSDMKTDYPNDPGCASVSDDTEETVCPGATCPVCSDGLDNDSDGQIDFPADDGCIAASANNEGCAGEVDPIVTITTPSLADTLVGASDNHDPSCVGSNFADKIFTLEIPTMQQLIIDTEGSAVDTVLSLMTSACTEPALACDDDGGVGTGDSQIVRNFVPAGKYTIAVDSDSSTLNTFNLNVSGTIVPGGSCEGSLAQAGAFKCGIGFACSGPVGSRTCQPAQCLDGIDNNGDGTADFPNDPGCVDASDAVEDTVCPGPNCPECADGSDNDNDGDIDYPNDSACVSANADTEGCYQSEPIGDITQMVTTGSTSGATNDSFPPTTPIACGSTTHSAPDVAYELQIPTNMATLTLNVTGFDTSLSVFNGTCGGTPLACSDPPLMSMTDVVPGTYYVVVDGFSTGSGNFTLTTTGTVKPGESCEGTLFQAGAFTCTNGFACKGTVGSRTCVPSLCADGIDNNGDGKVDFPDDPGCTSMNDDVEDDVCPGANCPECSDGADNDGDTIVDYPMDMSCFAASSDVEACSQSEAISEITTQVTTGTTAGQVNDIAPTCGSSTTAPDLIHELNLPAMASLTLNLTGLSGIHSLLDSTCGGTPIACSDPSLMSVSNLAAGRYFVAIDGSGTASGAYTLTTTGLIAIGGSCEGPLFQAGAFTCATGSSCEGTAGMRTCVPTQCADGMDNNGNTVADYPFDPGCTSLNDATEEDVCPGANCPVCSNTTDDDTDTTTDFPMDFGCSSASANTEAFCAIETQAPALITMPSTTGTLASPATDNYEQTCQSSTGNDLAYALQLPVPVSTLVIDNETSTATDTVLSVWDASCGTQLACDDDSGTGLRALITLSNVPAGNYAIQQDSFGSSNNVAFKLNVKGTVAPGTACTDALFTAGVLVCPTGTTCTAGTCQ